MCVCGCVLLSLTSHALPPSIPPLPPRPAQPRPSVLSSGGGCTLRACDAAHTLPKAPWPHIISYRRDAPAPPAPPPAPPPPSWTVGVFGNSKIRGLLNLTAPPASIDSSGRTDVTVELQHAITVAHGQGLSVYFPLGTYLVSDTLTAFDPNKAGYAVSRNNTFPCRFSPNVMIGERAAAGPGSITALRRPVIRLADGAVGFQGGPGCGGSGGSRPVVDFTMVTSGSHPTQVSGINFDQLFKGIDVVIGTGTPAAAGVQLPGAQGSSVQDVTVTVGSGYAGLVGGAGAGGSHEMVTVIGGRVGLDYSTTLNCPTITGATLINQTVAAIVYDGLEAGSVVGATIRKKIKSVHFRRPPAPSLCWSPRRTRRSGASSRS